MLVYNPINYRCNPLINPSEIGLMFTNLAIPNWGTTGHQFKWLITIFSLRWPLSLGGIPQVTMVFKAKTVIHDLDDLGNTPILGNTHSGLSENEVLPKYHGLPSFEPLKLQFLRTLLPPPPFRHSNTLADWLMTVSTGGYVGEHLQEIMCCTFVYREIEPFLAIFTASYIIHFREFMENCK